VKRTAAVDKDNAISTTILVCLPVSRPFNRHTTNTYRRWNETLRPVCWRHCTVDTAVSYWRKRHSV